MVLVLKIAKGIKLLFFARKMQILKNGSRMLPLLFIMSDTQGSGSILLLFFKKGKGRKARAKAQSF